MDLRELSGIIGDEGSFTEPAGLAFPVDRSQILPAI
jgi:hypothetical protein